MYVESNFFLEREPDDFATPEIEDDLEGFGASLVPSFSDAAGHLEARLDGIWTASSPDTGRFTVKKIVEAEPRNDYRLWVRFEDGVEGEVDLSDLVGEGVFERWEDSAEFRKVFVDEETDTVAWPGDIEVCPDSLYDDLVGAPLG